jgi:hypothetical protein
MTELNYDFTIMPGGETVVIDNQSCRKMTADEIIKRICDKRHPIIYQLKCNHGSNMDEVKTYMKQIADLAYEAGFDAAQDEEHGVMGITKEQFLKQLFPD